MPNTFFVSIEGKTQGKFKGESTFSKVGKGKIAGIRFELETISPRDAATGQSTGKRQHKPIRFTKELGPASPQIFQALVQNEILKTVKFEFLRTNANGEEQVHYTITLTNAQVARIDTVLDLTERRADPFGARELEDVELVFEKIELNDLVGKTSAIDEWVAT